MAETDSVNNIQYENPIKEIYHPDIDGLRAFAILGVLLFHLKFEYFMGGFIGVDVFFVISGYLITKKLYSDCISGNFSILRFLSGRFFRLYPSLVTVLLFTLIAGFLLLSPEHLKTLGESTIGAFFSVSNLVFLKNTGYFAPASETNPLLHTWALGVEQQFYLVWPFIIFLSFKFRKWTVPAMIFLLGAVSLWLSQINAIHSPSQAYFLPQYRVFEFAAGAMIFWADRFKPTANIILEALLLVGLSILMYCTMTYNDATPFPGFKALLPCVAAAVCIYAGNARCLGYLLRNKLVAGIGLISYSLYLVHWPVIVFYKYYTYRPIVLHEKLALLAASFLLAYPLYRFIENQFRRLKFSKVRKRNGALALIVAGFVLCSASYVYFSQGAYWRLDKHAIQKLTNQQKFHAEQYGGAGFHGESILGDKTQPTISAIVIGDSFAGQWASGLNELLAKNHLKAISIWNNRCLIAPHFVTGRNGIIDKACLTASDRALELVRTYAVPVIYAESWSGEYKKMSMSKTGEPITFSGDADYYKFIRDNIIDIQRMDGASRKVIVMGSPPGDGSTMGVNLKTCLYRPTYLSSACHDFLAFRQESSVTYLNNIGIKGVLSGDPNIVFLNPYDFLCSNGICKSLVGDEIIYSDDAHLSVVGSKMVIDYFSAQILALLR